MACWVCVQESTSSCHKSYTLALACGGGGLIRSLLGGRPPISAKQKRASPEGHLLLPSPQLPSAPLGARGHQLGPGVRWRMGWGARRRAKLRWHLKQEHGARRSRAKETGYLPPTQERARGSSFPWSRTGMEVRCKDGLTDGDSKAGGRGGDHSREWMPRSAGDNRGIEPGRVLGVTGQTES